MGNALALRWTIGDVSDEGFEALRLAVWGAYRTFGTGASYAICVNSVPLPIAQRRARELPVACEWHEVTRAVPRLVRDHLDEAMAEGVAWKFAPLRLFPERYELSLDNDCVLWTLPETIARWLRGGSSCLLLEDVRACFGRFAARCGPRPLNAGIRGFPPGFDFGSALAEVLRGESGVLSTELDEQGLQVAALSLAAPPSVVPLAEVTICSPFPPHLPHLGRCGAHFCGLNAFDLGWRLGDRPASELVRDHWARHRPVIYERVGLALEARK